MIAEIDLLFNDHDKDPYKSDDLHGPKGPEMIRCATRVIADNIVFTGIDNYLSATCSVKLPLQDL